MSLNTLPADRALAVRPVCALDVRARPPSQPVQAVPPRRSVGLAELVIAAVIVVMAAGALATSIL